MKKKSAKTNVARATVHLNIEQDLLTRIDNFAAQDDRTRVNAIVFLIKRALDANPQDRIQ